jgi:hypothetical protein
MMNMPTRQKRTGKILLGFFALMLAFTYISRGVDAYLVAKVSTVSITVVKRQYSNETTWQSHGAVCAKQSSEGRAEKSERRESERQREYEYHLCSNAQTAPLFKVVKSF